MGEQKNVQTRGRQLPVVHLLIGLVLVIGILVGAILYVQRDNNEIDGQAKSEEIIRKVSDLYLLPADEQPKVAEIKDKARLQTQDFYKQAENGDFVLVYEKARLAVLYRESADKLIKVSSVAPATPTSQDTSERRE